MENTLNKELKAELTVGFLLFPHLTQLDLAGPAQVFATAPGTSVHLVWKDLQPVHSDSSMTILPTDTFETCRQMDLICVPGGLGQSRWMHDPEVLGWLATQGAHAQWVTSVCSGSLLLGAAGLLNGYRAASHWNCREHLTRYGAIPDSARVCRDRNRITGGGVTAGIDMALVVLAEVFGERRAQEVQLLLEYAPEPPFNCGRPDLADVELTAAVKLRLEAQRRKAEKEML